MNKRLFIIWLLLFVYLILVIAWTIQYAGEFSDYVNYKGEEIIFYIETLLLSSIVLHSFFLKINKSIKWKMLLFGTLGNLIISIVLGFAIMLVFNIEGVPKQLIYLFGGCYLPIFTLIIIGTNKKSSSTK